MKRTPMARGTKPLVRTPFAKRGRMRRASRKMVLRIAEESPVRKAYKAAHQVCEMRDWMPYVERVTPCLYLATDLHEPWMRSAGGPTDDPRNFAHLCRNCHVWIDTQDGRRWALAHGFRVRRRDGAAWLAAGGRLAA